MAEHDFNTLTAALDSPLIVVTTADERERAGCLVEFHGVTLTWYPSAHPLCLAIPLLV